MDMCAFATIDELRALIAHNKVGASELLGYFCQRFERYDKQLGTALEIFDQPSIVQASSQQGPLYGIPGILKDNIAQSGRKLTCGSKILQGFVSPYDATASARLKQAGALLVGRANCDEFAMGSSNEYSAYFNCANPWDTSRVAGGSSGGPVAAVAAGLVPWALGSETGGSVRLPASWCNVVGLKPTYGRVSRYGLVAYASSLDQIGVVTRTVRENAQVFSVIAGHDVHDATSVQQPTHDYTNNLNGTLPAGLTIGVLENMLYAEGVNKQVQERILAAIEEYKKLGARIKMVSVPEIDYGAAVYFIVSRAEAASNLARFDGVRYGFRAQNAKDLQDMYEQTRAQGFGREVCTRILIGNYVLSIGHADAFYHNAKKVQRLMTACVNNVFKEVDVLLAPVHAAPAFTFGSCDKDPLAMDLTDYFTCFANLTQIPALSVPCGFVDGNLPTAFQLAGPKLSESVLYQVAHAYEQQTAWHTMTPPAFSA